MEITVVVPLHNAEGTIVRCLESIRAQTRQAANVIVVDDKSTDRSVELAAQSGLTNLEIVRLDENVGPGGTRNAGATRAGTEWLAFLDADDVWAPTFLEKVCAGMERYRADFGSSGGIRGLAYRGKPTTFVRVLNSPPDAVDLSVGFWRTALRFMPIHPSSAVIRRDLFQSVGGFCETARNGEDLPLWAALWLHGRFAFANEPLFTSIAPPTGLSAGPLRYADVRIPLKLVGGSLIRAIRARRPGTRWFVAWYVGAVFRRHGTWLVRRARWAVGRSRSRRAAARAE